MTLPVVAEVDRNGFIESRHCGSVIALWPDGTTALTVGGPGQPIFPRSANKPLQAAAMLQAGLDLSGAQLAVAAASHNGEPVHIELVRHILTGAGLDESALQNTPALPLEEAAAHAHLRAGGGKDRLHQNCSGKHAAMLATCVAAGWPTTTYLEPEHPLQALIGEVVAELAGEPVAASGVDGCGAPLLAVSLVGLARAFARLAVADPGSPERRVADAMRAHPDAVGGRGRDVTALMAGVPGLLAKDGAEAVYAAATEAGAAVAVKIDDGGDRARTPVLVAALHRLGIEAPVLTELATTPVLGGGRRVGETRALV